MAEHRQMFYTLANVHHQIVIGEGLPPFWSTLLDLPYDIRNATTMFELELEQLTSREAP
jgi:hypothetical protein